MPAPGSLNSWQPTRSPRYIFCRYRSLARSRGVGQDRRRHHAEADGEDGHVRRRAYLRLERVVRPLVGGRQLASAVLLRAGDPAEAGVEALAAEVARGLHVDAAPRRGPSPPTPDTRSVPSPQTNFFSAPFSGALASRNVVASAMNSSRLGVPVVAPVDDVSVAVMCGDASCRAQRQAHPRRTGRRPVDPRLTAWRTR